MLLRWVLGQPRLELAVALEYELQGLTDDMVELGGAEELRVTVAWSEPSDPRCGRRACAWRFAGWVVSAVAWVLSFH